MLAGALALSACATLPEQGDELAALEARSGGRLGGYILDTGTGRSLGHRADERFGMCSTFKLPLAGVVLAEIDAGRLQENEILTIAEADIVPHHPVTGKHVGGGLSILALAEATQVTSDNPAANLLIKRLGGPEAVTAKLRTLGDRVTRLDRFETAMNFVPAGEIRDTTTPRAMAELVATLLTGNALTESSRGRLIGWMTATQTGLKRIRAGLPADWRAGDKTGTAMAKGMPNKVNDVAIAWPPGRAPLIIAAYLDAAGEFDEVRAEDEAVLAAVGRIAAAWA